jgi:hypothetical protein
MRAVSSRSGGSRATRTGIRAVQSSSGVWYYTQMFY